MKAEKSVYGVVYLLREAANNEGTTDCKRLWAEVQEITGDKISENKQIEVFMDPQDFGRQAMESIIGHIDDELIDKQLFDKVKITVKVEYETQVK